MLCIELREEMCQIVLIMLLWCQVMVHHCLCKEDGCNGVASLAITGSLLLASLTFRFINTGAL